VLLTGGVHLFFEEVLGQKLVFIAIAAAFWIGYLGWQVKRDPAVLREWGFTTKAIGPAFRAATWVFGIGAAAIVAVGIGRGGMILGWHLLAILAIYPLWGLIQQFLVQALLARNLQALGGRFESVWVVTPTAALLFGIVHWPDPVLMVGTFLLGSMFTPLYLKRRNLWPLGIYHGWLGALVYFLVLRRDSWIELFG